MENYYKRTFDGAVFTEEKLKIFYLQILNIKENNFHAWLNENLAKGNLKIISMIEYNMGSFSWLRADKTTKRKNLTEGDRYKILIPKEFGGGFIKDTYYDYGYVFHGTENEADLYGILAYWNGCEGMDYSYECGHYPKTMEEILKYGNTCKQSNRTIGISVGCGKECIDKLKYPLKLVSASYKGTYEDCEGRSYNDPEQGFIKTYW